MRRTTTALAVTATAAALVATGALAASATSVPSKLSPGIRVVGLTSGDGLTSIDTGRDKASSTKSIKGLNSDERVVGIDYRPATNKLYGVVVKRSGKVRVVKISPATGNTYASRNLTVGGKMLTLKGSSFGVDFNPTVDRLRVVSQVGENLRIDVSTGATTVDGTLKFGAGDKNAGKSARVPSVAYTNSVKGATATTLYDIEAGTNGLLQQAPPNDGTLKTIATVNRDVRGSTGFDIFSKGTANTALISNTSKGQTKIYRISLTNGDVAATSSIKGKSIVAITAPTGR